jgi:nitrogen fixation-related uncharacterized protein
MEIRKGFEMPISVMIAIVIAVLFVAVFWATFSGFFDQASQTGLELIE